MLREQKVVQVAGESPRRWFSDDDWDLVIWQDGDGTIVGFQICYDRLRSEHALTWDRDSGFSHQRVDDGEDRPARHKQSPILVADGHVDFKALSARFNKKNHMMDPELADFIAVKLNPNRSADP